MNGMGRRFASKKDKDGGISHKRDKSRENKPAEKSTEKKVMYSQSSCLNRFVSLVFEKGSSLSYNFNFYEALS